MVKIYLIQNLINNKVYVGKTYQSVQARFKEHWYNAKWGYDFYFYKALRKYGPDSFEVQEIARTGTAEAANNLEKLYILLFRSFDPVFGYNGTLGGDGVVANDRVKLKLRESKLGDKNPMFGKKLPEHQLAILRSFSGKNNSCYKSIPNEEIRRLFMEGWSLSKIAKIFDVSHHTVAQRLRKLGVLGFESIKGRRYLKEDRRTAKGSLR